MEAQLTGLDIVGCFTVDFLLCILNYFRSPLCESVLLYFYNTCQRTMGGFKGHRCVCPIRNTTVLFKQNHKT